MTAKDVAVGVVCTPSYAVSPAAVASVPEDARVHRPLSTEEREAA